jgi:hypothetical protein
MLLPVGLVCAVLAALRSTWSPCGLSMLSTITPFGERGRGHRYWVTSAWFVLGSLVGGLTLGSVCALLAVGLGPGPLLIAAVLCMIGAAVDAGVFGQVLPLIRRQVDDRWLARYRPWFYASGFGWQVGVGLATYLMTAAVVVVAGLAILSGSWLSALLVCGAFGLTRGLTVFLTAFASAPASLRSLHAALENWGPAVRWVVVGVQVAAAILFGPVLVWAAVLLAAVAAGLALRWRPA